MGYVESSMGEEQANVVRPMPHAACYLLQQELPC